MVVLTSGGLKDPDSSRAWLPEVAVAGADLAHLLAVLRDAYGLALGR